MCSLSRADDHFHPAEQLVVRGTSATSVDAHSWASHVVAPSLYLLGADTAGQLARRVQGGGHLVTGFFSGIAGENDRVYPGPYPGRRGNSSA